ncbi:MULTISPECIES: DUF7312 domain-containing protein [Halomicrobium]|uniref:DUF7312 domain-containing protein n=2 Tax=Halomicrobium mukohataei TaxID=57705 RepID=C7P1K7_HALMD|nr:MULTISPECIES: hypothetical protein [Halomicrobium]ACV49097.1 hypothetical protein Hmuk_2992 [Halomicrobium mukohataei DSM 12286]QCD64513.1 hypothetical protein E5139_02235 [Halomicrobium mukohataei]QFR19319.1 hypothetical protein GBQ70_02235 [Halomicrobium sp. ZPS1]
MANDADSDDWKFSVDEVGPDAETATNGHDEAVELSSEDVPEPLVDESESDAGGNVAGSLLSAGPIEPEAASRENALFVVLGVYLAVFGFAAMLSPGFVSSLQNVLVLGGGLLAVALLSFGFFGLLTPET